MNREKTRLFGYEFIYWINMNADIEETIKIALHVLISRQHNQRTDKYHIKFQGGHGNLFELTFLLLIPSSISKLLIITASFQ